MTRADVQRRALLASATALLASGCAGDGPATGSRPDATTTESSTPTAAASGTDHDTSTETETETVGPGDAATGAGGDDTPTGSSGPGTIRVENRTDRLADVRVEVHATDGSDAAFLGYVLARPGSTARRAYSVAGTGTYRVVATLPTLGDEAVGWTGTARWTVASTTAPGTAVVTVASDGLAAAVEPPG